MAARQKMYVPCWFELCRLEERKALTVFLTAGVFIGPATRLLFIIDVLFSPATFCCIISGQKACNNITEFILWQKTVCEIGQMWPWTSSRTRNRAENMYSVLWPFPWYLVTCTKDGAWLRRVIKKAREACGWTRMSATHQRLELALNKADRILSYPAFPQNSRFN